MPQIPPHFPRPSSQALRTITSHSKAPCLAFAPLLLNGCWTGCASKLTICWAAVVENCFYVSVLCLGSSFLSFNWLCHACFFSVGNAHDSPMRVRLGVSGFSSNNNDNNPYQAKSSPYPNRSRADCIFRTLRHIKRAGRLPKG